MSTKTILKNSYILVAFTLISRVLGLARESVKAYFLGTTALSDAFSIAFLIPNLLRRLFAEGTIAAAFIPVFKGYLNRDEKEETKQFLSAVFTFGITIFSITVAIGIGLSGALVKIFAPEFCEDIYAEAVFLTQIMWPYLAFISVAALFQGVLNSFGVFGPSGFTPILFNLSFITAAFALSPFTANPARALAIGVTAGGVIQMAFQIPFVLKAGAKFSLTGLKRAFTHPGVRKVMRLISPTLLGMGAYQINIIATTHIANRAGVGIVSSLQFSNRLEELILGIFIVSLSTVILPELSTDAKKGEWENFNKSLTFGIKVTAMVSLPATIFTLLMRSEMVTLLFGFGKFDSTSVHLTAYAFMFHISGLFFIAVTRILFPVFYAQEDTVSPTIAGVVSVVVNIAAAYMLVGSMQGGGVALASSISAFVSMVILISLLKKSGRVDLKKVNGAFLYSFKFLIISAACGAPVYFLKEKIYQFFIEANFHILGDKIAKELLPFSVVTALFGVSLVALLVAVKDENAAYIFDKTFRRMKWKK
ncbi:MAG: murein biosynthesis integral membrane protein MurJ [bacterium]